MGTRAWAGFVFFLNDPDLGGRGLFLGDGSITSLIVDTTGPFQEFGSFALNDHNAVAFLGQFDAGGSGIFTGSDPLNDAVIRVGDTLDGEVITGLVLGWAGLNNRGQIAFNVSFADGSQAVYRATPVPNLPTGVLVALVLFAGLLVRLVRRASGHQPIS